MPSTIAKTICVPSGLQSGLVCLPSPSSGRVAVAPEPSRATQATRVRRVPLRWNRMVRSSVLTASSTDGGSEDVVEDAAPPPSGSESALLQAAEERASIATVATRLNERDGCMPVHSPQRARTSSSGRTCSTSSGARSGDRRPERLPAQLLDLAERPRVRLAGRGEEHGRAHQGARARSRRRRSSRPSSVSSSAVEDHPISSAASRTAHSTGVSPGSSLPPGSMNRDVPRLRTVSSAPSRRTHTERRDEDGHASASVESGAQQRP